MQLGRGQTPLPQQRQPLEWVVRILLECIAFFYFSQRIIFFFFIKNDKYDRAQELLFNPSLPNKFDSSEATL